MDKQKKSLPPSVNDAQQAQHGKDADAIKGDVATHKTDCDDN
jgi:hypothetical protein